MPATSSGKRSTLLASSIALFYIGVAFAYFVVFPLIFQFMASVTPIGVTMMTDINRYLDFVLTFDDLKTICRNPSSNKEWHRALSAVAGNTPTAALSRSAGNG